MRLRAYLAAGIMLVATSLGAISPSLAQQSKPDSTQATAVGALPPSNCPNIQTQWYATGLVPSGYYKQSAPPYSCLPIPACTSNQVFSTSTESCGCPAGTSWDSSYSTCHAPCGGGAAWNGSSCTNICPGGTAWNGTTCASICTGGQTWNGSSCSCPSGSNWNGSSCITCGAGTSWNGSTCASICTGGQSWNGSACACPAGQVFAGGTCGTAASFSNFSVTPSTQTVGSNYTVSWGAFGSGVSVALNCSGANGAYYSLSPATGGSGVLQANAAGSTTCVATASNQWGSSSASVSLSAVCSSGLTWNGSACACPAGQVFAGGACGTPPSIGSFTVSPSSVNIGTNYTVGWSTSGTGVSSTLSCSGANPASYGLPGASGTGALSASTPGTTNCTLKSSNAWGSGTASVSGLLAACPTGTSWNGSKCISAAEAQCTANGGVWNGTSCANQSCAPTRTSYTLTACTRVWQSRRDTLWEHYGTLSNCSAKFAGVTFSGNTDAAWKHPRYDGGSPAGPYYSSGTYAHTVCANNAVPTTIAHGATWSGSISTSCGYLAANYPRNRVTITQMTCNNGTISNVNTTYTAPR